MLALQTIRVIKNKIQELPFRLRFDRHVVSLNYNERLNKKSICLIGNHGWKDLRFSIISRNESTFIDNNAIDLSDQEQKRAYQNFKYLCLALRKSHALTKTN